MGIRKGRQYATTWVEKAQRIRQSYLHSSYAIIGGKEYSRIDCYLEALKRDPEYAEAWRKLGLEIWEMDAGEDTDKKLAGMDLFKDEPKITDKIGTNYPLINAVKFCFDKAIEIEPKNVDTWYEKGSWCLYWRPPDLKEGIECFLEVTKLDPKHKTAWFDLANAYSSWSEYTKAFNCYDKAIALSPDNLYVVYAKKADLFSKCIKIKGVRFKATSKSPARSILPKDALMCYDKALEIKPKYGYASYKKGMLLESLSRYEEALECFENFSYDENVWASNKLHKQALRDKLKPNEDGSTESFEIYYDVLKNFFKDDELSEVEYARKKLNENILQHIHKLGDHIDENDFYERGEWLQNIGREKEALELYDKHVEKSLEKGDLDEAGFANNTKAEYYGRIGRSKDEFDCYEKTIQFFEKSTENFDEDAAYHFASAYSNNAKIFKSSGDMDKAIEYIDHAIKLEQEYAGDDPVWWWKTKVSWLPDEEAIKFLDEEIKVWQNSSYRDEEFRNWSIENMTDSKNELLKKLAK